MPTVVVEVMPKPALLDPQGQAVLGAAHRLGFTPVCDVRQGKRFTLTFEEEISDDTLERVRRLAADLLANPVIEDFDVRVEDVAPDRGAGS